MLKNGLVILGLLMFWFCFLVHCLFFFFLFFHLFIVNIGGYPVQGTL